MENLIKSSISEQRGNICITPKFQEAIKELPKEQQTLLTNAVKAFALTINNEICFEVLWMLTYAQKFGMILRVTPDFNGHCSFGYLKKSVAPAPDQLPESITLPLREELRYQRKLTHSEFMEFDVPENCQKAFNSLHTTLKDVFTTYAVYNKCYRACCLFSKSEYDRTMFLLNSDKINFRYGGIRSFKFSNRATMYLVRYAEPIATFFKVLWENVAVSSDCIDLEDFVSSIETEESETIDTKMRKFSPSVD